MDANTETPMFGVALISGGTFVNNPSPSRAAANSNDTIPNQLRPHSAPEAIHTSREVDSQGICTPGTRAPTLKRIRTLATSSDPSLPDVVWMHGAAGAGKSAVMRTIAQRLEKAGVLLASFFFFRSESRRNKSAPFIPTLALQACASIPQAQRHISHSIQANPTIFSQSTRLQCLHLLQTPLIELLTDPNVEHGWTPGSPRVIVVDGLDECMNLDDQAELIEALAQLASTIRARTDRRLKILVASRPEHRIKTEFRRLRSEGKAEIISLNASDAKIDLYYTERLNAIRIRYQLPESWPSPQDFEWLMDKTSGQYAFAGVSTRFLAGGDPILRLKILKDAFHKHDLNPLEPLHILYATVFQQLPPEMVQPALLILQFRLGAAEPAWKSEYRHIIEHLFQLPEGFVSRLGYHLSSLINFDDDLRPYHATLADFLKDPRRSGEFGLDFNPSSLRSAITKGLITPALPELHENGLTTKAMDAFSVLLHECAKSKPWGRDSPPDIYPPDDELDQLLNNVNLSRLDLWTFSYLSHLCTYLRLCYLPYRRPRTLSAALRRTVHSSLPRAMKLMWQKKTASYREAARNDDSADILVGLMLIWGTAETTENGDVVRLLQRIFQANDELAAIDSSLGWNLSKTASQKPSSLDNILRVVTSAISVNEDVAYSSKCIVHLLRTVLQAGKEGKMHAVLAQVISCGKENHLDGDGVSASSTTVTPLGCEDCAKALGELQTTLLICWASSYSTSCSSCTADELSVVYGFVRHSPNAVEDKEVRRKIFSRLNFCGKKILETWGYWLTPAFLSPRKREIVDMVNGVGK